MTCRQFSFFICFSLLCSSLFAQKKPDALKSYTEKRYDEAISICLAEIGQEQPGRDSYVVLCWSLVQNGRYEEAEKWAAEGRKLAYYDQRLIEILGEAKYYLGKNEQALTLFQEYVSLVTGVGRLANVYYFMGEIYLMMSRYQHADIALTTAVMYENLNAEWWTRLGYAREMAKDYRSSLTAYEKALRLNSSLTDAGRGLQRVSDKLR